MNTINLTQREKNLIAILLACLAFLLVFTLITVVVGYQKGLVREAESKTKTLKRVALLYGAMGSSRKKPRKSSGRRSLLGDVEALAGRFGMKEKIQLNVVSSDKTKGYEGVDVKLDNLSLDELTEFVHAIESASPKLAIGQFEITSAFRSKDLLRLNMRVLAEK